MKNFKGTLNSNGIVSFNQTLFESQANFNDIVWVVDLNSETVEILWDNIEPATVGKRYTFEEVRDRIRSRYHGETDNLADRYTLDFLRKLEHVEYFVNPTFYLRGKKYMLKQSMTPEFDEDGKVSRVYIVAINVQEYVTEENLAEMEMENKILIDQFLTAYTSAYTVDLLNRTFNILHMAHDFQEVFTMNGGMEDMRRFVEEHVNPDDKELVLQMIDPDYVRERLKGESQITFTMREQYGGDERIMYVMIMRSFNSDNCAIGFLDVTAERKKDIALKDAYQAAQMASEAKTTFLANMSHDIRTPMNGIIGMTAIASAHLNEPDRVADCLNKINQSSQHLLGLINQVLDMSKIESGKMDLSEESFNFRELMDGIMAMNNDQAKAKGHDFGISIENLVHENVVGDIVRLEQIFNNLISNAIKYTPEGGKIEVSVCEKNTNKKNVGWYEVEVKDNGIGMSEDYVKNIFEPFTRASDTRASSKQGTGLGMAIARNIARMMNGDIKVESQLDQGSTFTVSFALKTDVKAGAASGKVEDTLERDFSGKRILLAEDNELNREIAEELLGTTGMEIESAEDGSICLDLFMAKPQGYYDLILMDIQMPVMDGLD
ncbi:MAG: response regulator, partial [Bacteroidaceae bacterium]|nr:response regulator [Bacteroidaceae bacterium]